ncbi:MAG: hypothetical protein PHQ34_03350 [Methanothrix sp.]|nr:hypothetical protein [Methanothrix sp.]
MDITIIKENIKPMDERIRSENQSILDDQEDFAALSAKLISDLIDKEPNTGRLPDVKVRFKKQLMLNSLNPLKLI